MVHLVTGLSGSGKTTVSEYLSKKLNAVVVNTDDLHRILFPGGQRTQTGDFTPVQLTQIYETIPALIYYLNRLDSQRHIVCEGSFRKEHHRNLAIDLMEKENIEYRILFIELSDETKAESRITERHLAGAPDTYDDYKLMVKTYEKPIDAYLIDNSSDLDSLNSQLDKYLQSIN